MKRRMTMKSQIAEVHLAMRKASKKMKSSELFRKKSHLKYQFKINYYIFSIDAVLAAEVEDDISGDAMG